MLSDYEKKLRDVLYGEMIDSYNAVKGKIVSKGEQDFVVLGATENPIMNLVVRQNGYMA